MTTIKGPRADLCIISKQIAFALLPYPANLLVHSESLSIGFQFVLDAPSPVFPEIASIDCSLALIFGFGLGLTFAINWFSLFSASPNSGLSVQKPLARANKLLATFNFSYSSPADSISCWYIL